MGFGIKELVVILVIVLLLFGTKKLRNIGSDLGGAIRGFRNSMKGEEDESGEANKDDADSTAALKEDAKSSEPAKSESNTKQPGA